MICSVENCDSLVKTRGWCEKHYVRWRRHGDVNTARLPRHGMSGTPENHTWRAMLTRCYNKNDARYKNYGGRGIKVCKRWREFKNFYADMGLKPSPEHSIDRIDNDGDYTPENCRWADRMTQAKNRSDNRLLTLDLETKHLADWCRQYGVSHSTVRSRMKSGLNFKQALTHKRYAR